MLVLSRRASEKVVVTVGGVRVTVTVCAVSGNTVRLGFEAPQEVQVNRGEVQREIDDRTGVSRGEEAQ